MHNCDDQSRLHIFLHSSNIYDLSYNHSYSSPSTVLRAVSKFLSSRFHPKSRRLFPFYFSNITLRTDLLTFGITGAVFKIASEMCRLLAYFNNPVYWYIINSQNDQLPDGLIAQLPEHCTNITGVMGSNPEQA